MAGLGVVFTKKQQKTAMRHDETNCETLPRANLEVEDPLVTMRLGLLEDELKLVYCAQIVFSQVFETCMGVIIVFNLAIIVYEADQDAMCYPKYMTNYFECPQRSEAGD